MFCYTILYYINLTRNEQAVILLDCTVILGVHIILYLAYKLVVSTTSVVL